MKTYLFERTKKEFKEIDSLYKELFSKWLEVWNYRKIHDDLYSLYVRLQILSVLLRSCLDYKFINNVNVETKDMQVSLRDFCNFVIHRQSGRYTDNQNDKLYDKNGLYVYLVLDTDKKSEVYFNIKDVLTKIGKEIQNLN